MSEQITKNQQVNWWVIWSKFFLVIFAGEIVNEFEKERGEDTARNDVV